MLYKIPTCSTQYPKIPLVVLKHTCKICIRYMPLALPSYQLLHPLMSSNLIGAFSNLWVVVLFNMIWVNLNCITAINYVMWLGAGSDFFFFKCELSCHGKFSHQCFCIHCLSKWLIFVFFVKVCELIVYLVYIIFML